VPTPLEKKSQIFMFVNFIFPTRLLTIGLVMQIFSFSINYDMFDDFSLCKTLSTLCHDFMTFMLDIGS